MPLTMPVDLLRAIPVHDIETFAYRGKESNFYANTFTEHWDEFRKMLYPAHRHSFYLSMLCTKGKGTHEIDFRAYDFFPGCVFLISPGQVHFVRASDDVDGYVVLHTREFYDLNFGYEKVENFPFFSSMQNKPIIHLHGEQMDQVELIYRLIVEEYRSDRLMRFQKIGSLLNVLYINLSRLYLPEERLPSREAMQLGQVRQLELLVNSHFKEVKQPFKYAEMMFMSERNLNRICKLVLDKPVSEVILDKVIMEAKRMLIYTRLSVSQISNELGYADSSYFTRMFRKATGQNPTEFQNAYREERGL